MTAPWREPAGWSRRDARRQEEAQALASGDDSLRSDDLDDLDRLERLDGLDRLDDLDRLDRLDRLDEDPPRRDEPSAVYTYGDVTATVDPGSYRDADYRDTADPGTAGTYQDTYPDAADSDRADTYRDAAHQDATDPDSGSADTPTDPGDARERHQTAIAVEAVHLLSQAQLIADNCVQEAEQYARDLVMVARTQYREILERAEEVAGAALAGLPTTPPDAPGPYAPVPEIEYVRTYAQVARVQLRSVLDALTEQVDRLGTLPDLTVERPEPAPGDRPDVSWEPEVDSAYR